MKVLYVNTAYYGGGAEKIARQLYDGMYTIYHIETIFLAGKTKKSNEIEVIYGNKLVPNILNEVRSRVFNEGRLRDLYTRKKILSIIKKEKIDIVHFHNIHGNYIGIEDIKIISKYCNIIWTLHDMWSMTGHCAYPINCEEWLLSGCKRCKQKKLYPSIHWNCTKKILRKKQECFQGTGIHYVVPSEWLKMQCKKSFLKNEDIVVIQNGVDLQQFQMLNKKEIRKKLQIPEERFVIAFSANDILSPYKGADILQKALNMLPEKNNYYLIILGNGILSGLDNALEFLSPGKIRDDSVMNEYYSAADLFVIPSRAENFPCVVLESLASGTPILGSAVGGIVEQIDNEVGWTFESGNASDLRDKIIMISKKRNEVDNMRFFCRKKAESIFPIEKMLEQYYKLYIKILNKDTVNK